MSKVIRFSEARLRAYEARLARMMTASQVVELRDLARIRKHFREFFGSLRALVSGHYSLNQWVIPSIMSNLAHDIDTLSKRLGVVIKDGLTAKDELAREMAAVFGKEWIENFQPAEMYGIGVGQFEAAQSLSAKLIGWSEGGLSGRIQDQVDNALRMAVLGVESKAGAISQIGTILGYGEGLSWQAERIYRTEVNRFWSLMHEAHIERLAQRRPMVKRWIWSGISREEHARIHGQTIKADGFYRVPRKQGGEVSIKYPRAVTDRNGVKVPGDVTINCGCWSVALPVEAAAVPPSPVFGHKGSTRRLAAQRGRAA